MWLLMGFSLNAWADISTDLTRENTRLEKIVVKLKDLENKWFALVTLSRIVDDADKSAITQFINKATEQARSLALSSRMIDVRMSRDALARDIASDRLCLICQSRLSTLSSKISSLESDVTAYLQSLRTYGQHMRGRAAIARRAPEIIRKTDQVIATAARSLLSPSQQDADKLKSALSMQDLAKKAFANRALERSLKLTLKARDMAQSLKATTLDTLAENIKAASIAAYAEMTLDMITKIEALTTMPSDRALQLLTLAKDENARSATALSTKNISKAFLHARQARGFVDAIMQENNKNLNADVARLESALMRIENAKELVAKSGNALARDIMSKAIEHRFRAEAAKNRNNLRIAKAELDIALRFAAKAADIATQNPPALQTSTTSQSTSAELLKRAQEIAQTPQEKQQLTQAKKILSEALASDNRADLAKAQVLLLEIISQKDASTSLVAPTSAIAVPFEDDSTSLGDITE